MHRFGNVLGLLAALSLAACGSGGGGGGDGIGGSTPPVAGVPNPAPPAAGTCSLRSRQDFAFATLNEWYLFPETLPPSLDPTPFSSVDSYVDALTATARSQGRDRFFTFVTSIAEENAFNTSGATAGFGVRFATDTAARRLVVMEAFEGAPALAAGLDRGTEVLAIGTTTTNLRTVSDILANEGSAGISTALGPSTAGTARTLQIRNGTTTSTVTVTKATFNISPVSSRYGAVILTDGTRRVAYLNLRTFISSADSQLRSAFDQFRSAGITDFVIDFRYNGGGLVSTAELMGDLLGGNRTAAEVFSRTTFRPSKSANDSQRLFRPQSQSVAPVRIAFIGTGATASASELVMNSFIPYYGNRVALIGSNTFGKPVGQIAVDRAACDDRVRVVAFATQNSAGNANYFGGMKTSVQASCAAIDDLSRPLGDPNEASTRAALDFLAGRTCAPIAGDGPATSSSRGEAGIASQPVLVTPAKPSVPQREVPGLF